MDISLILIIILLFTECLSLINTTNSSNNNTLSMLILTTIQSSPSLINHYVKRRSSIHFIYTTLNMTNDTINNNISLSINKPRTFENSQGYNIIKDGSNLTKTQIKVIVTVVIIISFIMFIIAIFRFTNSCRDQETHNIQTEIIHHRVAQYSEPSSRRGSIGYYTRKYTRTPGIRFDEQLNISSPIKQSSVSACNPSSKPKTTVYLSYSPRGSSSATTTTSTYHHYVTSPYDTSINNNNNNQHVAIAIKPTVRKSSSTIGISRCDDQTPLLTSELASVIKDSSNRTTRKYSLNAFLPLVRSSNSHPLSLSSTTTAAISSNSTDDGNKIRNNVGLKSRRRVSLSSALHRRSFTKHLQTLDSKIDSSNTNQITSIPITSVPIDNNNQSSITDSDNSDRTSLLKTKTSISKNSLQKKSSNITPIISSSSSSSYRKDFMHKIERFRFIDDSASSTTTVTSPVESIDPINGHQPCSHLITSAIEQFDDYVRSRYHNNNDEINSYIDRLNSDILTNGSYSDLNILNSTNDNISIQRPQTIFKPVNNISSQSETGDYRQTIRNSAPITIPSQHSKYTYPSDNSIARPTTIITTNGHSRSMDFQSINNKHEISRPITLTNTNTIYETSSSSIATLTSVRSLTSLEFDDDTKPSGVLVDDDFLPMSSPVDEHFWDMTMPKNYHKFNNNNKNESFPNVGSSPVIEIKHFDLNQIKPLTSSIDQPLSETSCDEDDNDDDDDRSLNQQKFSIHEYKLKELQKPIVIHRSIFNPSIHSTESTNHNNDLISIPIKKLSLNHHTHDDSLLEKFALSNIESIQIPIRSPPLRTSTTDDIILSSQQYPQTIYEEDDTQESSTNDNISDESADNGEIDLVHEFELSKKQEQTKNNNNLWSTNDHDIFILQEDDLLSALVTTQTNRPPPPSIMKITQNKSFDSIDEQQITTNSLKPKVRFNLDPQYEREREWNKVNKLLGNSVEWTDEFEV